MTSKISAFMKSVCLLFIVLTIRVINSFVEISAIPIFHKAKKKNMCVYCHMLKKIRVGRSEIIFFLILFCITELMLDGI